MQKKFKAEDHRILLLCLAVFGLMAALFILPSQFSSLAGGNKTNKGLVQKTVSQEEGIENYDIREDKTAFEKIEGFRQSQNKDAVAVADIRGGFVRGEEELKTRIPNAKVEYNSDIRTPEVITPDVWKSEIQMLTAPSSAKRADILRNFVKENNSLIGITEAQADSLKVVADYTNPDGNLSFAHLEQRINDVPVFRGEVKAGFTKDGRVIRVINNLAAGLNYESLSTDFGDPLNAVKSAAGYIKYDTGKLDLNRNSAKSDDLKTAYGQGDWATTAEKMYFPTEPGVARAAWRVLIWEPVRAYYVIVDAEDGTMLWRKNLTNDQTQAATYNVYSNTNTLGFSMNSPAPAAPGPIDPTTNFQAPLGTRSNVTLIGNEAANGLAFNNLGWITDGSNGTDGFTDGNAVEAGLDIDGSNGVDAAGKANGTGRVFNFAYVPGNVTGGVDGGEAVTGVPFRNGIVTHLFYLNNRYHDALYKVGFTEPARNYQNDNFGRGGIAGDRVSAEAQDSSGTNNANFSIAADGTRGRMQMYVFTGSTPARDGDLDGDVVFHEFTHGVSQRLVGNGAGLTSNRAGSSGEGWGDLFGFLLGVKPADPVNGVYSTGGYVTYRFSGLASFTTNYYHGIRRFPYAPIGFTGGPSNRPHNPLTLADIQTVTATDGAFTCSALIGCTGSPTEVHNAGEVWAVTGVEVWGRFATRLTSSAAALKTLQYYTDGMKLSPLNPTFIQSRDSVIAAAAAAPLAPENALDVLDVREGFRRRGMGFSATDNGTSVVEAFDSADLAPNTVSVTSGNNLLEPNECNTLNVPITNNSANDATGITAVLSTTTPGITVTQANSAYPNIAAGGGPINNTTPYQVSVANTVACFTQANFTLTITYTGAGGGTPGTFNFSLPVGLQGLNYAFTSQTGQTIPAGGTLVAGSQADDAAVALTLPSGWASTVYGTAVTSLSASTNGMLAVNAAASTAFTNTTLPAAVGTTPTLIPYWDDLVLDTTNVTGGGIYTNTTGTAPNRQFIVEWKAQHFSETANGPITTNFAVVLTEGSDAIRFIYAATGIGAQLDGAGATVGAQAAATGTQFTQFSFNTASLSAGLQLTGARPAGVCTPGSGTCGAAATVKSRADFDGDGRTDLSVFRPSEGNWYLNRSTSGFGVIKWGLSADTLTPGDFDGDGKADTAIFRPDANSANPDFYVLNSNGFTVSGVSWGVAGDIPVVADYDGDGKSDVALFRPSNNTWYILKSGGGITVSTFGQAGDVPVAGDFDGDGRGDLTVYRSGTWISQLSAGGMSSNALGSAGDILVPADYDGDNKDDIALFRPSTGQWFVRNSMGGAVTITLWGTSGDVPVPGDYDGDGKDDFAIYRNGQWWLLRSTTGISVQNFGVMSDKAIPRSYIP
jgi:hypothetical protein